MSHAAIEIKTIDKLNHQTVSLISSKRDKLRLAGTQKRHPFYNEISVQIATVATMGVFSVFLPIAAYPFHLKSVIRSDGLTYRSS